MHLRPILCFTFLLLANIARAQLTNDYQPQTSKTAYPNGITLNFPGIVQYGTFSGISIGAEYRRLLNTKGTFGVSLSYTRLIWAGTEEAGEYYAKGQRANIQANLFGPGFNYYPFGSNEFVSAEIGVVAQLGSVRRVDSYQTRNSSNTFDSTSNAFFFAPQLHAGFSILGNRHFLLTFYGDFGPMLACDKRSNGNYGTVGVKIGRRF